MSAFQPFQPSEPPPVPPPPVRRLPDLTASFARLVRGLLVVLVLVVLPVFFWFFCRIEPEPDEIAILIRKTGQNIPSGNILAQEPTDKGIQVEVLAEGRYFRNPYSWGWEIHPVTDIPAGRLGVVTRLHGEDLPGGEILAREGTKGIRPEVLRPGKYRINPYAEHVEMFDAINIRPGHVGVVTALVGQDVMNGDLPTDARNQFLVGPDRKGVQETVLDPGTYYLHPYMFNLVEVNLQSQRFEMSGKDVISFLTEDGFTVTVEGTIEFGLERDQAALLTHRVGDMEDIIKKVILPRARGFSRIEGSKHPAIDFIVGETRQRFQNDLEAHLRLRSKDWGVAIKSVLVRRIIVPEDIASINREREVAVQDAVKYVQQIIQAQSEGELVRQEMLAEQSKAKVVAETHRIKALINANQGQEVVVIGAEKDLEVARLELEAAVFQAQAVVSLAEGEKDGIQANNLAEAAVLSDRVNALESGINLARFAFYQKLGPAVRSILSSDQDQGLGTVFTPLLPEFAPEVQP